MKQKYIDYFMKVAELTADLSYARRLQVGAIVVKDNRIISLGYNGSPAGWSNNCEDEDWMSPDAGGWLAPDEIENTWPYEGFYEDGEGQLRQGRFRLITKPEVLHAERNALDKLARGSEGGQGAIMFVTHEPCLECAKSIYGAGIEEVIYKHEYRSKAGVEFLEKAGVKVTKY